MWHTVCMDQIESVIRRMVALAERRVCLLRLRCPSWG
jgi:hypothetical protein